MMDRFLRRVLALAVVGVALATVASANVPDPTLSHVKDCVVVSPNCGLVYQCTILGSGGPVNASTVEIRFNTPGDTLICWCLTVPGPRPRSFFASTNVSGVATFTITAGGCIQNGLAAIPGSNDFACEIFADGIKMQEAGVVSPDAVDNAGNIATDTTVLWDPAGSCRVGLADAVQHTTPLSTAVYQWCTDITCDDVCGVADAVVLTPCLANAANCPGDAGP
jgi:hypothetical protein